MLKRSQQYENFEHTAGRPPSGALVVTPRKVEFRESLEQRQEWSRADADDRRSRLRFSLRLAIRCRRVEPRFALDRIIVGESLNIASRGMLFRASEAFLPGQVVEVFIDWPIRLENGVRLMLVVEGAVVRIAGKCAAMLIEKYQVRTCGAAGARAR
jgi:hypothetical protein